MIERLGKYEIRRELARGAMGVVYEAYDPQIKRRVALKTIRPDQLDGERAADMLARFRREAQAAGRLSHPNIVAIYEFDEDAGTSYIAMEFVEGHELRERFAADERFRLPDVVRIMTQILSALDYSHARGVVHRDIKPANIFVQDDGTVKVADFGIAHVDTSHLTQVGTVVGTPNYMSPEQIMGLPVDGRADLFAAGVILYQFLTGERPFAGSTATTMQKVLKEEPLAPSTLNVQLPPAIDAVVKKALAKRPEARFQTAAEFSRALADAARVATYAADADATAPNVAPLTPSSATVAPASAPPSTAAPIATSSPPVVAPSAHRQRTAMAVVAVLGVIGIAAIASVWRTWSGASGEARSVVASAKPAPAANVVTPDATSQEAVAATAAPTTAATKRAQSGAQSSNTTPVESPTKSSPPGATPPTEPGTLVITAVGYADPSSPRYANDRSLLQSDVRRDSQQQLVVKALRMMLDRQSVASHYALLQTHLLAQSGDYVGSIVQEGAPQVGKDGLMSVTTQAVVNVDAIRRTLDRMSRDERIQWIRASGDPRIAVRISVRGEGAAGGVPSPIAENIVKERVRSFGFRTWQETAEGASAQDADFVVTGEMTMRRLSTKLEASGLVITKYALASWTVKCTDRASGEEIYFDSALPKGLGSYASEEAALRVAGTKVADSFSRDFFLAHVPVRGRKTSLALAGLPDDAADALLREIVALPAVIGARMQAAGSPRVYDVEMRAGNGSQAIVDDIIRPLNAKLGDACFSMGTSTPERSAVAFDARCAEGLRARLESSPPAALFDAPPERRKAIISNPEMLKKLLV
ncbi:MAG TPA: protein kinase [Casimicrobiaceae bacterium]|nr:protein kinase [Casimicrobiaceae bacterium]